LLLVLPGRDGVEQALPFAVLLIPGRLGTFKGAIRFGICGPVTASASTLQTCSTADAENAGTITDVAIQGTISPA
jgi:hypothetical protein